MKISKIAASLAACSLMIGAACTAKAATVTIVSQVVEDIWLFNSTDRNEIILNNSGANPGRRNANRYDAAILAGPYTNPLLSTLTSATLTLNEEAGRNANNGTLSGRVGAAFYDTTENGDWALATYNNSANSGPGVPNAVGGWFGNSGGRSGRFGGGSGGAANLDDRTNGTGNPVANGVDDYADLAQVAHTFDDNNSNEQVVVDLTTGGASLAEIQSILADWVAGNNAGLYLTAEFGNQAFFQSQGTATGMSVGSTVNGDSTNSGVAIDGGTGTGGSWLTLTFEVVPEPTSFALFGLAIAGSAFVRRRS